MADWLTKLNLLRLDESARHHWQQRLSRAGLDCWRSIENNWLYAYSTAPVVIDAEIALQSVALTPILDLPGVASAEFVTAHYVVETDVLPEFEDEFNAWYDQEHLPGLARVPGTVRAIRYRAAQESPRYYACYNLVSANVLDNPSWLAVRATDWSSRVRPAFCNTRRTMFRHCTAV